MARPNLHDPSIWPPFPGTCEGCWAGCCHLPVDVDVADLLRLGWIDARQAQASPALIFLWLKAKGRLEALHRTAGRFVLARGEGGRCHLLGEDARCTVYDQRPETCRAFPGVGPRSGYCPTGR